MIVKWHTKTIFDEVSSDDVLNLNYLIINDANHFINANLD